MSATPAGTDRYLSIETAEDIGRDALSLLNREVWRLRSQIAEAQKERDEARAEAMGHVEWLDAHPDVLRRSDPDVEEELQRVSGLLVDYANAHGLPSDYSTCSAHLAAILAARSTPERGDPEPATEQMRCTRCGADIPSGREAMYTSCDACWREVKAKLAGEGV